MNLYIVRRIDETLGDIICVILGWLLTIKRILFPSPKTIPPHQVKTIMCQKYFGMGSILNTLPVIIRLKEHYPNARFVLITLKQSEDAARLCNVFDDVLTLDIKTIRSFIKSCIIILNYLLRKKIDISLDFEFYAMFTLIISFFSLADIKVGLHLRNIRPEGILTHKIYYNPYKHISSIYLNYAVALGIPERMIDYKSVLPSFKKQNETFLTEKFKIAQNAKIVTINVNCGDLFLNRRWPADYFITLIQSLLKNYPDMCYTMIGGKSESGYVSEIIEKVGSDRIINCAGKTTVEELFALIEMSYLLITNDSGPLHIASFYGINTAVFFGPETPIVYGPINSNALVFQAAHKYCSPCLNVFDSKRCLYGKNCTENTCLTDIKPEAVYNEIESRFLLGDDLRL